MGKSLGNAIYLSDDAQTISQKVKMAVTDPSRIRLSDPGHPEICTVSHYHKVFNTGEYQDICEGCQKAQIGCMTCKKQLAKQLNELLEPIRTRRAYYEAHREEVKEIIASGSAQANQIGSETIEEVKHAMNINLKFD